MLATRRRVSEAPAKLGSITTIAAHLFVTLTLAVVVCCLFSTATYAQGSLSLGTVDTPTTVTSNTSDGWYYYTDPSHNVHNLNCLQTTVRSCSNAADWPLTFGYLNPVGIVPGVSTTLGTIVFFTGDGGGLSVLPGNFGYANNYFKAGYEIVELAWNDDWEYTYDPFVGSESASIQNAACRPATFMKKYVYDVLFAPSGGGGVLGGDSGAGFCAHGASAGSAATAYSLAYYGAGAWLDNVELISGPVFSDVEQGCMVSTANTMTNVCPSGQYGCQLGSGGSSWTLSPHYVGVNGQVGLWTKDNSCRGSSITTSTSNSAWLAQSIVDQSTGATPSFSYSATAMSGWLCRSVASGYGLPNNSSSQGQIFFANFTSSNHPLNYNVYAVDNCQGAENVGSGNVPGYQAAIFSGTIQGSNAVVDDMVGYHTSTVDIPAQCVRRTH
jgi:hypothetical protein